jgi:DNA-directed RNA polymerase specialized sigma24 family protein
MPSPNENLDAEALLARMRSGDREAAAEFVQRYSARIRRRARSKLGPSMRRLFDSQEILSTLGRRLDAFIRSGRLQATTSVELWTLVCRITDNALIEKARVFRNLQAKEGQGSPLAGQMLQRFRSAEQTTPSGPELEMDRLLRSLDSEVDREILSMWLNGTQLNEVAESLGRSPIDIRRRWQGIRKRVRAHYLDDVESLPTMAAEESASPTQSTPGDTKASESAGAIVLRMEIPALPNTPAAFEELKSQIRELVQSASRLHIAHGGDGLKLKEMRAEAAASVRQPAGDDW